ncbi:MAG: CBS domain-containing protein [Polyangiales bacterium]
MKVVIAHESADFDAFAAAMLATRLYEGAVYVATGGFGRGVRAFATLHRDRFGYVDVSAVDWPSVTFAALVDVRRLSRLEKVRALRERIASGDPTLCVHVWDHHAASAEDARATMAVVERVGSTTTLLLEAARERGMEVDHVEATLYALAIHADTGSLTFANTTARDAEALAWLMRKGADLAVINRFLNPPWSALQREALSLALESMSVRPVRGARVGFTTATVAAQCEGLDEVTSELLRLSECDALFTLWSQGSRVRVIARSKAGLVDVARAVSSLGGGGHATAATVAVRVDSRGDSLAIHDTLASIEASVAGQSIAALRVGDVMSSPVHSVSPTADLRALRESLRAWRHSGVPVLRDRKLVGIVCLADLERAESKRDPRLSVASIMRQPVRTTVEDATLEEALERMAKWDVGRLPVLRGDEVVGIVTRVDARRVLYGEHRS